MYGLTVDPERNDVFVSQRERGLVKQLEILSLPVTAPSLTASSERSCSTPHSISPGDAGGRYLWTPCREAAQEEPQSEGLFFDAVNDTLYVAFETIGLYRIPLGPSVPHFVEVSGNQLIEPVTSFGRAYRRQAGRRRVRVRVQRDSEMATTSWSRVRTLNAGAFVEADFEGLAMIASRPGQTLLLASSQGDSSFHFYSIRGKQPRHLGSFQIEGVGETDGVHYVPVPLTTQYPLGLLVVQNGDAPEPDDTSPINGYEFDGATQFKYVNFLDTLRALVSAEF